MDKIILFQNGVETLSYFSKQLGNTFIKMGKKVFYFDLEKEEESMKYMFSFWERENTFVVTFNFNGLRGEDCFYDKDGVLLWKYAKVPCVNIVVDHPFYYYGLLQKVEEELGMELYYQISIDRDHEKFMKRFYPQLKHSFFLPLAGTRYENGVNEDKKYEVVFAGNYTAPEAFRVYIERINQEYAEFYEGIITELIQHPELTMEDVFEKHLTREMGELSDDELKECMSNMIFIDLYVRFYFRAKVVTEVVNAGIQVHVFGTGWETVDCPGKKNLIIEGPTDSEGCLNVFSKAKVSLNVMPWFKDGAHDRVYNSMLNGAVCVTDESEFLKEDLNEEQIVFYSLKKLAELPEKIKEILMNEKKREQMINMGTRYVEQKHTWEKRGEKIIEWFTKEKCEAK